MKPRIAFYAPLKPPDHPIPSGDREIARNLVTALERAGYQVDIASRAIAYQKRPSRDLFRERRATCLAERDRLLAAWLAPGALRPDLWFTYHPYCKAPDWIGPAIAKALGIAYVTAETCRTRQATDADWAEARAEVRRAARDAAVNFCLKPSDRAYLASFLPDMTGVVPLAPFIDAAAFEPNGPAEALPFGDEAPVMIAVAMMRPGAKMESYALLAEALDRLRDVAWNLVVVGDGPGRDEVATRLAAFGPGRIHFTGAVPREMVTPLLRAADVFVWPGVSEAIGMAYLEAQAVGLPVAACATAGVPTVVADADGGLLSAEGDASALAANLRSLITDAGLRARMAAAARQRVRRRHSIAAAADTLRSALDPLLGKATAGAAGSAA